MKKLLSLMALGFALSMTLSPVAYAAAHTGAVSTDCAAKSAEKKLAGAAKASFEKKCMADAGGGADATSTCEKSAADKKLAGAAKSSHMKKCLADAGGADPTSTCEKSAADKKLAGAAKSSHMKKCLADAGGAGGADKPTTEAKPMAATKPVAAASAAKK